MTGTRAKAAVPRLRFKGREGAWTRQPIGELFSERDERSAEGELLSVTIRHGVVHACDSGKADSSSADKSHYKVVKIRDLAYNSMRMWQGACGASKFDGIVSPAYTVIVPNAESDSEFFEYTFKRPEVLRQFQRNSQGMTSDTWNLKFPLLKDICISCPEQNTQVRIASAFRNFDKLILLESSHLTSLRQLKRAMLVKMFPRPGQCVPEIRFKGFDDEWEYRTLGYYLQPSGTKNYAMKFSREDVLSVSGEYGIVNQIKFKGRSFAGASVENYGVVERGDIVYTKSPLNQTPYGIIKANLGPAGIVSTLYAVYKVGECADPSFVQTYFSLDGRLNSYLRPLVRKGAKNDMKVSAEGALRGGVIFPSLSEQRKIAAFFRNLDRVIGAAEKKVAKLRQVKASLLERMFV